MSARSDLDTSDFRIPARAWFIALAFIVLAGVAMIAVPGEPVRGCFFAKTCNVIAGPPFYVGVLVLVIGAALSTWLGGVPRHWVVGWTATTAAIAAVVVVAMPLLVTPRAVAQDLRELCLATGLSFCVFWIVQIPGALVASLFDSPLRPRVVATEVLRDDRPQWLREVAAVLASIDSARASMLTASETQLVAELVFRLESDDGTPTPVVQHAARLRSLLSRDAAPRQATVLLLTAAAHAGSAHDPYRLQ